MSEDFHHRTYPMLRFVARFGDLIAAVVAGIVALCAAWALGNALWLPGAAGVLATGLVYMVLRAFGELVRLILDVMHPP